jgi:hypothetical protein
VLSRTACVCSRVTLFGWRQEQESVMTEQPPKHEPSATDRPQSTPPEHRARVKAHVRAVLKRLNEQLR